MVVTLTDSRFNEAAGIPRGRHSYLLDSLVLDEASMRPRVFPAEDGEMLGLKRESFTLLQ